ncbi:MAG: DUF1080 domain-containing protein [Candidatus Hydrogenedentes bacterium]|nr:DUF1080 domain-containing protein [Candidatus Hydrogenedentota bacterium]
MFRPHFRLLLLLLNYAGGAVFAAETRPMLQNPTEWIAQAGSERSFTFESATLSMQYGGAEPSAILTRDSFENFDLSFEFNYHQWAESGLYLHAPWNGAFEAGIEIELSDHFGEAPDPYYAGAIHGHVPARVMAVKRHGEWNSCSVHMDWPKLLVTINGLVVQDLNLAEHPELRYKLRRGAIGFQNCLGWEMKIRNLELTPLPSSEATIPLFNGKDLSGWKEVRKNDATWSVEEGVLVAHAGSGYLQHERLTRDFALQLYYRSGPAANGGVFFRWKGDDSDRGNEIQILDVAGVTMPSGSIYDKRRSVTHALTPGEWTLMQIFVSGKECRTFINGTEAAYTNTLDKVWPGHITLQMHNRNTGIRFRDIDLIPAD